MHKDEIARFKLRGFQFIAYISPDEDADAPWDSSDGHGPVTKWENRPKRPGELILASDGRVDRFYDFQAAVKLARRDRWDSPPYKTGKPGERAARAARADFEFLRGWCNDQWSYVGVIVERVTETGTVRDRTSLWGIESNATDYLQETARDLAQELVSSAHTAQRQREVKQAFIGCSCPEV